MNTLDIVLLLLFIPGIIRGLSKGLVEQAISLGGILISAWLAYRYYIPVSGWVGQVISVSETAAYIISFTLVLIVVLTVLILLAKLLTKLVEMATLGWLNRLLGMALAVLVSALTLGLLISMFDSINGKYQFVTDSPLINESVLYPVLKEFAEFAFPFLKQLIAPVEGGITTI